MLYCLKQQYVAKAKRQHYVELTDEEAKIKLYDLIEKKYENSAWDYLLNLLIVKQMTQFIGNGLFNTGAISNIFKPKTVDPNGPSGFTNFMTMIDQTATVYDICFYACESLNLIQDMQTSSAGANYNVTHRASLRNATHDILYAVANSCAMNGYGAGIKYGYDPVYWKIAVYFLNGVAFIALAIWGFFSIWNSIKRIKKEDVE